MYPRPCRWAACIVSAVALVGASCNSSPLAPRPPVEASPSSPPETPTSSRVSLYTLTISSSDTSGPCAGVPDLAKRRVYLADVEQAGSDLKVVLTGAEFVSNTFRGVITPAGEITFTIRPAAPWDYDAFDVLERLSDGSLLIVSGVIAARTTAGNISGSGGEIRPAHTSGSWCQVDSFEMVPRPGPWDLPVLQFLAAAEPSATIAADSAPSRASKW